MFQISSISLVQHLAVLLIKARLEICFRYNFFTKYQMARFIPAMICATILAMASFVSADQVVFEYEVDDNHYHHAPQMKDFHEKTTFMTYDVNRDGQLDKDELLHFYLGADYNEHDDMTKDLIHYVFHDLDSDKNHALSWQEFREGSHKLEDEAHIENLLLQLIEHKPHYVERLQAIANEDGHASESNSHQHQTTEPHHQSSHHRNEDHNYVDHHHQHNGHKSVEHSNSQVQHPEHHAHHAHHHYQRHHHDHHGHGDHNTHHPVETRHNIDHEEPYYEDEIYGHHDPEYMHHFYGDFDHDEFEDELMHEYERDHHHQMGDHLGYASSSHYGSIPKKYQV